MQFQVRAGFQSPTAWWPDDRAWCVATDVDGFSTYIAGTQECIGALARDPRLEIVPAQPSQAVDPSPYPHAVSSVIMLGAPGPIQQPSMGRAVARLSLPSPGTGEAYG
jgi:hypothetical protein